MRIYTQDERDAGKVNIHEHYEFVNSPEGDEMHIELVGDTPFKGTLYKYGKVGVAVKDEYKDTVPEDAPADALTLKYEYDIVTVPSHLVGVDFPDEQFGDFERLLGDILVDIMDKDFEEKKGENETDTNNTETSVSE
jgi:hypothetical protein